MRLRNFITSRQKKKRFVTLHFLFCVNNTLRKEISLSLEEKKKEKNGVPQDNSFGILPEKISSLLV